MKTFALCLFAGCVALNIAGNIAANTTEGLQEAQHNRIDKLCPVNQVYCS